jgi:lipopolysaccharide export system protein LptA
MRKYRASLSLPLRGMALAASLALVVSVQAEEPLSVEAESISYSDEGRVVSAEGNVRVKWGENQLSGDSITIEHQERRISGQGGLRFETPDVGKGRSLPAVDRR